MTDNFGDGSCPDRHNRLAGCHRFEEDDAKSFLYAGKAEDVGTVVLCRELAGRDVTDPAYGSFQVQFPPQTPQSGSPPPTIRTSSSGTRVLRRAAARSST